MTPDEIAKLLERLEALDVRPWTYSLHTPDRPPILPFNPDGPEAAALIRELQSTLTRVEAERDEGLRHLKTIIPVAEEGCIYHVDDLAIDRARDFYNRVGQTITRPTTQPEDKRK